MINWNQFTVDNGAITDLRELLFLTAFQNPDFDQVFTTRTGVINGKKLGYIDELGDVGENHSGCNPTYTNINVNGIEKEWNLGPWEIAKHICYSELENTIAEESLNVGTDRPYLQDTPYWDTILMPLLEKAMIQMLWRIAWFGDKGAKNIADGGILKAGIKPALFTMCDGLWKRLQTIISANPHQQTVIAANTAKNSASTPAITYASQKEAIRQSGVAVDIVDTLLSDADSRIFDKEDHAIYMTNSLFKALRNDVKRLHNLQLTIEAVGSGIQLSEYDGHRIVVLDVWDRMIKKYEDTGTALNNPHRAVVCSPSNLFVGTNDTQRISSLSITFNDETKYNNIYAASKIDTLVGEDALVQVAI